MGFAALNPSYVLNAGAQRRPLRLLHIEMATEIEQGDLLDFATYPFGTHQPVSVIPFAGAGVAGYTYGRRYRNWNESIRG